MPHLNLARPLEAAAVAGSLRAASRGESREAAGCAGFGDKGGCVMCEDSGNVGIPEASRWAHTGDSGSYVVLYEIHVSIETQGRDGGWSFLGL